MGLVEHLVAVGADPRPDDDILTEAGGDTDSWAAGSRPDGDVITRSTGECDRSDSPAGGPRPRPDEDIITKQGAENDNWRPKPVATPPKPRPDDDTITFVGERHSPGKPRHCRVPWPNRLPALATMISGVRRWRAALAPVGPRRR